MYLQRIVLLSRETGSAMRERRSFLFLSLVTRKAPNPSPKAARVSASPLVKFMFRSLGGIYIGVRN